MDYEIDKNLWQKCVVCKATIKDILKKHGGCGVYAYQAFIKHLEEHDILIEEYFEKHCKLKIPLCSCGICNQKVSIKKSNPLSWKKYACGRNPGILEWSEKAKITRKGRNNPMYGKPSWNLGLTSETSESMKTISEKMKNRIVTDEQKIKMSNSAKARLIHGHTGHKHTEESKQKCRIATINRIKNGCYKQTKTKPHLIMIDLLNRLNISFENEKIIDCWSFDLYLPEYNVLIEVDGDYFHSNPNTRWKDGPKTKTQKINYYRDQRKNLFCKENNLKLIRFWENDIINHLEEVECKLKKLFL